MCILQHTSMHATRSVWVRKEKTASSSSSGRVRRKVGPDSVTNCMWREGRSKYRAIKQLPVLSVKRSSYATYLTTHIFCCKSLSYQPCFQVAMCEQTHNLHMWIKLLQVKFFVVKFSWVNICGLRQICENHENVLLMYTVAVMKLLGRYYDEEHITYLTISVYI